MCFWCLELAYQTLSDKFDCMLPCTLHQENISCPIIAVEALQKEIFLVKARWNSLTSYTPCRMLNTCSDCTWLLSSIVMQPGRPSSLPGRTKLQATTAMRMTFSSTCIRVGKMSTTVSLIFRQFGLNQWCRSTKVDAMPLHKQCV